MSESEDQLKRKYAFHDLVIEDLKSSDLEFVRSQAITGFIHSTKSDAVTLTIEGFMSLLTKKGFRIVKGNSNV